MPPCRYHWLVLFIFVSETYGDDPFEKIFVGSNCLQCREVTNCNTNLWDVYQPKSPGAGMNKPTTKFFLFTRKNPVKPECLHYCGGRLPGNTNFNNKPDSKTFVIFNTFTDGVCTYAYSREIKDEYLKRGDYNVIIVDWIWGNSLDLSAAQVNQPVVADQSAFVIENILNQAGVSAESFTLIGWSLAAHLAGFVGKRVKNIGRITGLDPAGSAYVDEEPDGRLAKTDAKIVDIIHTNAGKCVITAFGIDKPIGHADFYVNGGQWQVNCFWQAMKAILKMDYKYAFITSFPMICSHSMAIEYYKASINPGNCQYIGVECPNYALYKAGLCKCNKDRSNCAIMGFDYPETHRNDSKTRVYHLDAEFNCPYCSKSAYQSYLKANETTTMPVPKIPGLGSFMG